MSVHRLEPSRQTLHGCFSRELEPALIVESGDRIELSTLDAGWGLEPHTGPPWQRERFTPRVKGRDSGHALCGPIGVRGAEPGMVLEVRIERLIPGRWGCTFAGGHQSELNRRLGLDAGDEYGLVWEIDAGALLARNQWGDTVRLRPFLGVLGNAPAEPGMHSTFPPRPTGGNLDCKELVEGSTLFLPIAVPGALLSVGDGHALQGDGEVCGQAIECPMDHVGLTLTLREGPLHMPKANTPAGWITFGLHEDLDEAALQAIRGMLEHLSEAHGWESKHALAMASLTVDLRVTQLVNGVRGVHAVLAHDAFMTGQ